MSKRSPFAPHPLIAFGVELLFYVILVPLSIALTVGAAVYTVISAIITFVIRGDLTDALASWHQVRNMHRAILRHVKYDWRCLFPQKRAALRVQAEKQRAVLQARPSQVEFQRAFSTPDFDAIDVFAVFAMLPHIATFAIVLVHAVTTTFVVLSLMYVIPHYGVASLPTAPQPEVKVMYEPQIADQQEADYGPWFNGGDIFEQVNRPDFQNLALISDTGTLKYAQTFMASPKGFAPYVGEKILNPRMTEAGQIRFTDQHAHAFTVNRGQAFIFENHKAQAFMFDSDGRPAAIALNQLTKKE